MVPVRGTERSRTTSRVLPAVLAVLGPLVVFALAATLLEVGDTTPDSRRVRGNFACENADIVITGSSRARTDIDPDQLAQALAPPPHHAMAATVHGSNAPVWYAVLKNGIFARGCRPDLIIVYDIADKLFAADVLPDERIRLLAPYLTGDDPVIEERIYGKAKRNWWTKQREKVARMRESWMATLAAWATGLMFVPHEGETRVQQGRRILTGLFDGVFAGEKLRKVDGQERVQVMPAGVQLPEQRDVLAKHPDDTFLPAIIELVRRHGARVLVARAPSPPSRRGAEHTSPELARGCAARVTRLGAAYVDLRSDDVRDAWYADVRHMNALGRRYVTQTLADHIRRLELLASTSGAEQGLPSSARRRLPPVDLLDGEVQVVGEPPPLPSGGDFEPGEGNVAVFWVPGYRDVAADACEAHALLACCSPLVVTEDDVALPFPGSPLDEVSRLGHGRYAHVGDKVFFTAIDGSNPSRNGRTYRVKLADDRYCGSYWLLPGETLVFSRRAPTTQVGSRTVSRLEFWARRFSPVDGRIRVRLTCDGATRLQATLSADTMQTEPAVLPMDPLEITACRSLGLDVDATAPGTWAITWARLLD